METMWLFKRWPMILFKVGGAVKGNMIFFLSQFSTAQKHRLKTRTKIISSDGHLSFNGKMKGECRFGGKNNFSIYCTINPLKGNIKNEF